MIDQLKAVIFDVDGTLAETERDGHRVAFNFAFLTVGLDWIWDEALYGKLLAVAGGKERIVYYLTRFNPDFCCEGSLEHLVSQIYEVKTRCYLALLEARKISLRSGVFRLVNDIRAAGLRMAIATASTTENVTTLLTQTFGCDSLSWFECIATGDLLLDKKPDPAVFNYCLTQLALPASDCLVIEDSGIGVKAAITAGIPTIVTFNSYTKEDDFSGALSVFDQLGDPTQVSEQHHGCPIKGCYVTLEDLKAVHASNQV